MKAEVNAINQSNQSTTWTIEHGAKKEKHEQNSANETWDQDLTRELIPRLVNRQEKVLSVPAKKISIKLGKQKISEKVQETKVAHVFKDADPNE